MEDTVKLIQKAVKVTADGKFGPKTLQAVATALKCSVSVKAVQSAVGTKVDGYLGPNTYKAIAVKLGLIKESVSSAKLAATEVDALA